jgi:hypothetical protein
MKKYLIEREIPRVGTLGQEQLRGAAARSNQALHTHQWLLIFENRVHRPSEPERKS